MEQKQRLERRPRPGKENTHMGKCSPHSNESCRRNGKNNRHQHHKVQKQKLPQGKPPTSEGLRAFQDYTWKDNKLHPSSAISSLVLTMITSPYLCGRLGFVKV
jgi:hypothetical protein